MAATVKDTCRHPARQVANALLKLAAEAGETLTPMQLIKLVYLCHGWMLGLHGRPLITEPVEAWAYGPVVRDLYDAVKKYRSGPVTEQLLVATAPDFDEVETDTIRQTYEQYGKFSGPALSRLTHMPHSPWSVTYDKLGQNAGISNDLIQDHFAGLAQTHAA